MDKRILKEIARRWVKGYIKASEAFESFHESVLNYDEIEYIQNETMKIAERITDLPVNHDVNSLVAEYKSR